MEVNYWLFTALKCPSDKAVWELRRKNVGTYHKTYNIRR